MAVPDVVPSVPEVQAGEAMREGRVLAEDQGLKIPWKKLKEPEGILATKHTEKWNSRAVCPSP